MRAWAVLLCAAAMPYLHAADLNGAWELSVTGGQVADARRVVVSEKDGRYSLNFQGMDLSGTSNGSAVEWACEQRGKPCGHWKGEATATSMHGTGDVEGIPITWTAKRPAVRRSGAPARHEFQPVVFYREFSSTKEPALRIFPGDTVHTRTVDAGGRDEQGVRRVFGGNPLTGPFYVEGAMPGDTLVVKFTRIRLNRDSAGSGDRVVGSALEPYFFRDQAKVEKFDSDWKLDREAGVAALKNPTGKLKNYRVPLRPMLGCIGVAPPAGQSFRSGYLGDWGGNMDYNRIREGVTVYLPVAVPGALLFVGDGHAAQGDGELTGDALETSMDVEFTVNLETKPQFPQPRFEDGEYIMVSGVANSLEDALRRATTGLSRYLAEQFKLNPAEVGIVLGSSMIYDIAEVVDPQVHVVARLPRSALASLSSE